METIDKVYELLREISGKEKITTSDKLLDDLAMDSFNMVMLLIGLEDAFDIELEESDMNPFDLVTVNDVIALAEKYRDIKNE